MNLSNETLLPTEVLRECLEDVWGYVVAISKATFEVHKEGLILAPVQIPIYQSPCSDAPSGEVHYMMEPGVVDLTCVGEIHAPQGKAAKQVDASLRWGEQERRLRAFGRRSWRRGGDGELTPSEPEPFTSVAMDWSNAFGGARAIPAGFAPHTTLPMPAGEIAYATNRSGIGFYLEESDAEGQPLPNLEDPENLVRTCTDRPTPVCFAPCPRDSYLRAEHIRYDDDGTPRSKHGDHEMVFARGMQNAPPSLQVRDVGPGTFVSLSGMNPDGPFFFHVPDPGVHWVLRLGTREKEVRPGIVAIQLRPSERRIALLLRAELFYPLVRNERREAKLIKRPA